MKVFATILVAAFAFAACASASPSGGRVIKGEDAVPHSAPYIVSLSGIGSNSHICGGSIIATQWVITAGHCIIANRDPVGMGVVAGLHNLTHVDEATQKRIVDFGRVHEMYDKGVAPYDIALLHVSVPFDFNVNVQPVALPTNADIYTGISTLYGWGQVKAWQLGVAAKNLQTVDLEVIEYAECEEAFGADSELHPTNVCTSSSNTGLSACQGDSGGPLVVRSAGAPAVLIGVVSWVSIPCGTFNLPSVYTRMSAHVPWVYKIQNAYYSLY